MQKYSYVGYDWKQGGCEDEYKSALKKFGLVMTTDPVQDGNDQFGFFITRKEPTPSELKEIVTDYYGADFIEECGIEL